MQIALNLHPKQGEVLTSEADEILYGGAAGGGKSFLLRAIAIIAAIESPGTQIYLFRLTYPELIKNHLRGSGSFYDILAPLLSSKIVEIVGDKEVRFANGSIIHLCHCQHEKNIYDYQGAEIHLLLMDELTHFSDTQYRFLRSRLRLGAHRAGANAKIKLPRVICGSNPGGIGHQWVKAGFVDSAPAYTVHQAANDDGGFLRQFIPAKLSDNPTMDATYAKTLAGLGNPELVKAMLDGNWDVTFGAALEKLSRQRHMLRSFVPPMHWQRFVSMDWGSAKPFSVSWNVVCDDDLELKAKDHWPEMYVPAGSVIRYREWYGWNGQPDQGCRMETPDVARGILDIEWEAGEWEGDDVRPGLIDYRVADNSMWSKTDGPSPMERLYQEGVKWMRERKIPDSASFAWRKCRKDRAANYQEIRHRINGRDGRPLFYATENCKHFWRTVPSLQLDELKPELGPDTNQEDHAYDDCVYGLASRPLIVTQDERIEHEYKLAKKLAHKADREQQLNRRKK